MTSLDRPAAPSGTPLSEIDEAHKSLSEKTDYFERLSETYMTPEGLLGPSSDSAIWTGIYVAAEATRYATTRDPDALSKMEKSLWGLHALHEITGIPGLISRTIAPVNSPMAKDPEVHPGHGKYEGYLWKGNLSFDQYLGYLYGIAEAWPYIRDPELKALIQEDVRQIALHFIRHGGKIEASDTHLDSSPHYYYEDRWPFWLRWLSWIRYLLPNRGGNAMEGLHILKVASYVTGDPEIERYYDELVRKRGYAEYVQNDTSGRTERELRQWAWLAELIAKIAYGRDVRVTPDSMRGPVGMNLGHIALYDLARLEQDPRIRSYYLDALQTTHEPVARHSNSFWNFLADSQLGGDAAGIDEAIDSLERFPPPYGPRMNSQDGSIAKYRGVHDRFFKSDQCCEWFSYQPLPLEKRPMHAFAWQQNALEMDGQYEPGDAGGADYLAAYWLGRRYGFIDEDQ